MGDEPTGRELLLQIQALVAQVGALTQRVDRLAETLSHTYVPRGEYSEARRGDDRRFHELERDNEHHAGFRRQVAAGAIVGILLLIANIILAVARIPGGS